MQQSRNRLYSLLNTAVAALVTAASALVLSAILASQTSAQGVNSPYRYVSKAQHVDVFGVHLWPSEGRLGAGPNPGVGGGIRWGTGLTGPISFELEAAYAGLKRPVVDTAFATDSTRVVKGEANMGLLMTMANVRFNLTGQRTWHSFQPFVQFNGGVVIDLSKEGSADELVPADVRFKFGTSFAGGVGGGIEYFVSPNMGVRVDAGTLFWKLKAPTAFITKGPGVIPASEWERNTKMSAGLSLHF